MTILLNQTWLSSSGEQKRRYFEDSFVQVKVKQNWTKFTLIVWTKTIFQNIFFRDSAEESNLYRFGASLGWVNDYRIVIFGWSVPLKVHLLIFPSLKSK